MSRLSNFRALANVFIKYPLYAFHLIQKKIRMGLLGRNISGKGFPDIAPLPLGYDLILTFRCNLRCSMCMQWGGRGWCKDNKRYLEDKEMPLEVIEKMIVFPGVQDPFYILFGGEPLLYSGINRLIRILRDKKRFTYVCTNGTMLDTILENVKDNPYLVFMVALDGLEQENDFIRGKGVYRQVVNNIKKLKSIRPSNYTGLEFTVLPENVNSMYAFCKETVKLGIDWIVFNLRWFVSAQEAKEYEEVIRSNFNITPSCHLGYLNDYPLSRELFMEQYKKIRSENWPIQISWMPPLSCRRDLDAYLGGYPGSSAGKFCYKEWMRMDVLPTGEVTACKQFPDLIVGDLNKQSVEEVWNSDAYKKFRRLVAAGLLPVCGKCNALYLYDNKP